MKEFNLESPKDAEELALASMVQYLPEKFKVYYTENFKDKFYRETVIKKQVDDEL